MGLNIRPEMIQQLRTFEQSAKFKTFSEPTQERLRNLSAQFDEEGNKKFITRESRLIGGSEPLATRIGKRALLQVPFVGSAKSATTERNLMGQTSGRLHEGLANVQKDILARPPVKVDVPSSEPGLDGDISRLKAPIDNFFLNAGESLSSIGPSFIKGSTGARRDEVHSPLGFASAQGKDTSSFISDGFKKGIEKSGALNPLNPIDLARAAPTVLKATANDIVGMLNDLSLDPGINMVFAGTGPLVKGGLAAGASKFAGTKAGVVMSNIARAIKAIEETSVFGGNFKKRFGKSFGDYVESEFRATGAAATKTAGTKFNSTEVATTGTAGAVERSIEGVPQKRTFQLEDFSGQPPAVIPGESPPLMGRANPVQEIPTRATPEPKFDITQPTAGKPPLGSQGPLPPLDESSLAQGIRAAANEPPPGFGAGRPELDTQPRGSSEIGRGTEGVEGSLKKSEGFNDELPPSDIQQQIIKRAKEGGKDPKDVIDELIKNAKEEFEGAPGELKLISENMVRQLENLKKKIDAEAPRGRGTTTKEIAAKATPEEIAKLEAKIKEELDPAEILEVQDIIKKLEAEGAPEELVNAVKKVLNQKKSMTPKELEARQAKVREEKQAEQRKEHKAQDDKFKKATPEEIAEPPTASKYIDFTTALEETGGKFPPKLSELEKGIKKLDTKQMNELWDDFIKELEKAHEISDDSANFQPMQGKVGKYSVSQHEAARDKIAIIQEALNKLVLEMRSRGLDMRGKPIKTTKKPDAGGLSASSTGLVATPKPKSPLQQGIHTPKPKQRPLTPKEIEDAKKFAKDAVENMMEHLQSSAKRNKRGVDAEIEAVKAELKKQIDSGELDSFAANIQRRILLALEEAQKKNIIRQGGTKPKPKKVPTSIEDLVGGEKPVSKKITPISNTNTSNIGELGIEDLIGGKSAPKPVSKVPLSKENIARIQEDVKKHGVSETEVVDNMIAQIESQIEKGMLGLQDGAQAIKLIRQLMDYKNTLKVVKPSKPENPLGKNPLADIVKNLEKKKPVADTPLEEGIKKPTHIIHKVEPKPPVDKPPAKKVTKKKVAKKPDQKKPVGIEDLVGTPEGTTGKFVLVNKSGKPTGAPFATREAAQAAADRLNKNLGTKTFTVQAEKAKPVKVTESADARANAKKVILKEQSKTPLEEGIQGKAPAVQRSTKDLSSLKFGGKQVTPKIATAAQRFLDAEKARNAVTRFDGKGPKRKVRDTPERDAAMQEERFALDDFRDQIMEDFNVTESRAIKIINKILTYLRDIRPGLSIDLKGGIFGNPKKPVDVGPLFKKFKKFKADRLRKKRIKKANKLKKKREGTFASDLKAKAADVVKEARRRGKTVEELIRENPEAFPKAPKDALGLQRSIMDVLKDVPISVKTLKKNDIVQFRPSTTLGLTGFKLEPGAIGVVEKIGTDTISVRFREGLSEIPIGEASKFLREGGQALRLKDLPHKKLSGVTADILSKNPELQTLAEIANAAVEAALKNPGDGVLNETANAATKRLIEALRNKTIDVNDIASIAKNHNMSADELLKMVIDDLGAQSKEAGQVLNILSQMSKKLKKILTPEEYAKLFPESEPAFSTPNERFLGKVGDWVNKNVNRLKGMLTAQLKTASRNAFVQGTISAFQYANELAIGAYLKITKTGIRGKEFAGARAYEKAVHNALGDIGSFARNLKKLKLGRDKERALFKILDEFPQDRANLFGAPIHDVLVNEGFIRVINAANILQETVFRTIFMEAEMAKFAAKHGTHIGDSAFWKRHADIMPELVENSLINTFASDLKNKVLAGRIIQLFKELPLTGFLVGNPFVRFWFNNLNMMLRKSPLGFTNLFDRNFQAALQGPNNAKQVQIMADALQGTLILGAAMALRSEKYAGPKYYLLDLTPNDKTDDKFFDTRPFAPLPQYLFAVELAKNMMGNKKQTTLTGTDMVQGAISVSRLAGTAMVGIDYMRSEPFKEKVSALMSKKSRDRMLKSFAGQIASAVSVPVAQFQDLIGSFDPSQNKMKSTAGHPFWGPTINNIPFLRNMLPDMQQIGRPEPATQSRGEAALEFATGFRVTRMTQFEQVLAQNGVSSLGPRTGDPVMNQRIVGEMNTSRGLEILTMLTDRPSFKNASAKVRQDSLAEWMSRAFTISKDALKIFDSEVAGFFMQKKMDAKKTAMNKKLAGKLMDMTLKFNREREKNVFSETRQKLFSPTNP